MDPAGEALALLDLPDDVLVSICSLLAQVDRVAVACSCKLLRQLASVFNHRAHVRLISGWWPLELSTRFQRLTAHPACGLRHLCITNAAALRPGCEAPCPVPESRPCFHCHGMHGHSLSPELRTRVAARCAATGVSPCVPLAHLAALPLHSLQLEGLAHEPDGVRLPPGFTQMTCLRSLALVGPAHLPGPRPLHILERLPALTELRLERLAADGDLGASVGALSRLARLSLRELPEHVRGVYLACLHLTGLRSLEMVACRLPSLPASISRLSCLTRLVLDGNELASLPAALFGLTTLHTLSLAQCFLGYPRQVTQLRELTALRLGSRYDRIVHLARPGNPPSCLRLMAQLRELDVAGLGVLELPSWLERLTSLRRLDLSHNRLRQLSIDWGCLPLLERLDVSHNALPRLHRSFSALTSLTELRVRDNHLTELPKGLAQGMQSLRLIDLRHNRRLASCYRDLTFYDVADALLRMYKLEAIMLDPLCDLGQHLKKRGARVIAVED